MKHTFKEISDKVPQPKPLTLDSVLPYEFDLFWDAKTFKELFENGMLNSKKLRMLREAGYDTTNYPVPNESV